MPLYEYTCDECGECLEVFQYGDNAPECCNRPMRKQVSRISYIRVKGQGYPSRRKWMDNWSPASPPFPTVSVHGEKK